CFLIGISWLKKEERGTKRNKAEEKGTKRKSRFDNSVPLQHQGNTLRKPGNQNAHMAGTPESYERQLESNKKIFLYFFAVSGKMSNFAGKVISNHLKTINIEIRDETIQRQKLCVGD
ncbi:MAG: hypothetical protein K2J86_05650, partial [Prevotella sp.]|nr:hypothetical protein [Prevotella sp.]